MSNRLLDAYVVTHKADPAGAELRVMVRPEALTPTTEIKGRLMGPRSPYASTVEIAYPYRELARTDHLVLRVLIPEPSFWAPKTPLLYEGPLELWDNGLCCERITLGHGIRVVQLSDKGLLMNGRPFRIQGMTANHFTESDARRWHEQGVNCVLMPAEPELTELLPLCDRFGLFVLGRIDQPYQWPHWPLACQRHASFLGTVLTASCRGPDLAAVPGLKGAEVETDGAAPAGRFDFVMVPAGQENNATVPTIIKCSERVDLSAASANVLGCVRIN